MSELFEDRLTSLLNEFSRENDSNTPDFILARFLLTCLDAWNAGIKRRAEWYNRMDRPGQGTQPIQ